MLFSVFSLVTPEHLRLFWLGLNLAATVLIFCLINLWLGDNWPLKAQFYLIVLFLSGAPFRVTLRNGQLGLIITAMVLTVELARQGRKEYFAGVLLGFSLCKYPLTYLFPLYFLFKRRWRIAAMAVVILGVLTQIFAFRMHRSLAGVTIEYARSVIQAYLSSHSAYIGSSEIKPFLFGLTGGNETLSSVLSTTLSLAALIATGVLFSRTPHCEHVHIAVLTLFSLWTVYHWVHDSVVCIIPAALLIDFVAKNNGFSLVSVA